MLTCRARALAQGRLSPSVDDVRALAEPILQHRMALTFAARADGIGVRDVIRELAGRIG
jgi:MoxR-like ATPase